MPYGFKITIIVAVVLLICAIIGFILSKILDKKRFSIICHFFSSCFLCLALIKIIPITIFQTHALFVSCGVVLGVIVTCLLNDFLNKAGKKDSIFIILFSFLLADFVLGICFSKGYLSVKAVLIILIFEIAKFYITYSLCFYYSKDVFKSVLSLLYLVISSAIGVFIGTITSINTKNLILFISLSLGSLIYIILAFLLLKSRKFYSGKATVISMIVSMILIIIGCFWI